jgi:xanthine dehydrogenase small subunit
MRVTSAIRIVLNDQIVQLDGIAPTMTLLDFLRGPAALRGTKEGCAEGDCGACTVLRETEHEGRLRREPINACLAMVGQLDGCSVRTVEGLRGPDGEPHPVQRALAEGDGTQCGFCTPGFVMAICAYAASGEPADTSLVHDALAGNLCRCTGYRPIVEAALASARPTGDPLAGMTPITLAALGRIAATASGLAGRAGRRYWAPQDLESLLALRAAQPEAVLLAGGTDLGLLASRDRAPPSSIVDIGRVAALRGVRETDRFVEVGAALPYADFLPIAERLWPSFARLLTRLGSRQIRSMGTLGGNLGTASPIGDTLPVLLALDAVVGLRSQRAAREVPVDAFFEGYRRTVLAADEVIVFVRLPKLAAGEVLFCDKVSKRRDQDIAAVCGAYRLRLEDGVVRDVRLAFGGMAATPARAAAAEAALRGAPWAEPTIRRAAADLARDFAPLDDLRGSAAYRLAVAGNLLHRLWLRTMRPDVPAEVDAL